MITVSQLNRRLQVIEQALQDDNGGICVYFREGEERPTKEEIDRYAADHKAKQVLILTLADCGDDKL